MSFAPPPERYDPAYMVAVLRQIEADDKLNRKRTAHIEMNSTTFLILHSPDGTKWKLTVSNAGVPGFAAL